MIKCPVCSGETVQVVATTVVKLTVKDGELMQELDTPVWSQNSFTRCLCCFYAAPYKDFSGEGEPCKP